MPFLSLLLRCSLYVWFPAICLDMLVWFLLCLLCLGFIDFHTCVGFHQICKSFNYHIFKYFSAPTSLLFLGLHLDVCSTTQYGTMGHWSLLFFMSPFSLFVPFNKVSNLLLNFSFHKMSFFSSRLSLWFLLRFPLLLRLPIWAWIMSFFSYKSLNIFTRKNLKYLSTNSTYLSSLGLFLLLFFLLQVSIFLLLWTSSNFLHS